jgi:hypothetical protein
MSWFLFTSTSWGLFGVLGFGFWFVFGFCFGCAERKKQMLLVVVCLEKQIGTFR